MAPLGPILTHLEQLNKVKKLSRANPQELSEEFFLDHLPMMGSESGLFQPEQIADWMAKRHRTFFCLAVSLYSKPVRELAGFRLMDHMKQKRVAVWKNDKNQYFVGCRGTAVLRKGFDKDLADDAVIAGFSSATTDISLVREAEPYIKQLVREVGRGKVSVGGHSLGGFTAMILGARFKIETISWNGGAPPTKPVLTGPGPKLATAYHIMGDLVSTHVGPNAAKVIRVDKGSTSFGVLWPHSTDRFLKEDPTTGLIDATTEDRAWVEWSAQLPLPQGTGMLAVAEINPIPGSTRKRNRVLRTAEWVYDLVKEHLYDD